MLLVIARNVKQARGKSEGSQALLTSASAWPGAARVATASAKPHAAKCPRSAANLLTSACAALR